MRWEFKTREGRLLDIECSPVVQVKKYGAPLPIVAAANYSSMSCDLQPLSLRVLASLAPSVFITGRLYPLTL